MSTIPLVMTASGPIPTPPATLQQTLIGNVAATNPGYTANLPGSLVEDISSTDVGALTLIDQARVDAVNDVTPYGANAYVLAQQGLMLGIPQGTPTNASVFVVFTGTPGYVISPGFIVSDGSNQYALQEGGIVQTGGQTPQLFAVCTNSNTFAIPAGSVTQVVTSVATGYTLTVTNPEAGTPAAGAESVQSYRSRVLQSFQASSTGAPNYLKGLLYAITGVQQRLVSINQSGGGWQIICGGGDPYAVANAILNAMPDISTLQGSALGILGMTAANPVVITTNLESNFVAGNTFTVSGATPSAYNGTYTVASVSGDTITTTTNGSSFGSYTSGATFSPNPRNVAVSVYQQPNTYTVTFVNPPAQVVTVDVVWNTTLTNFTAGQSVNQLAAPAIQNYINSIFAGQPINELEMTAVFQGAVASVIDESNITTLEFTVTINGVTASPTAGTSIIPSDPEGYFSCSASAVTVTQG